MRRAHFVSRLARHGLRTVTGYVRPFIAAIRDYLAAEMEYVPEGWYVTDSNTGGWRDPGVADAQEKHWPILMRNLQGPGPLGVSHLPWSLTREDRTYHNVMMSYGYVLARAARTKDRLSILDWGGGAGHYYLYSRALLPEVKIDYHCYDVPSLCQLGRKLLPDAQFHDDDAELWNRTFDIVVSSSSLHYFEHWREVTRRLASATRAFLYIARLQSVTRVPSFVALHRLHRAGYTEYLSWCINRQELVSCAEEAGLELVREFVYAERWYVQRAPEKAETRGFLFRQRSG